MLYNHLFFCNLYFKEFFYEILLKENSGKWTEGAILIADFAHLIYQCSLQILP